MKNDISVFRPIWAGSGLMNFYGEGYRFHRPIKKIFGNHFPKVTFLSKTTTIFGREGFMPLNENLQPRDLFPACIYVNHLKQIVLNAVSLSGPGFGNLLFRGLWQEIIEPWWLSFMPVENTLEKQIGEIRMFRDLLIFHFPNFLTRQLGVQINLSCPNTGHDVKVSISHILALLDELDPLVALGIVISVKISVEFSPELGLAISRHRNCHVLHLSNTVRFRELSDKIDWDYYFGSLPQYIRDGAKFGKINWGEYRGPGGSPLVRRKVNGKYISQPGGLSGAPLKPLVVDWLKRGRKLGIVKPINAGGGIRHPLDIDEFSEAGADSFSVSSAIILAPHQFGRIVKRAYQIKGLEY